MENNDKWVDDRLATLRGVRDWQPDEARGLARMGEQLRARRVRRRRWALTAGVACAVCVSLPALPLTRVLAKQCVETCVVEASRVSDLLWHKAPASGRIAPDFVLTDASRKPVRLSSFRGKVVLKPADRKGGRRGSIQILSADLYKGFGPTLAADVWPTSTTLR
jgi:hypothetical protein